ncbi:MAG: hypothetical protein HFJ29_07920 [Clostridia bacterium]|nr:hypothetical protein [Clostridia bacterium]
MEKNIVLEILKSTENLLYYNDLTSAKEYIRLEIENLEGITPKKCRNTIYPFFFCDRCSNKNCPDNENKAIKF